jgi:hypothetical protein
MPLVPSHPFFSFHRHYSYPHFHGCTTICAFMGNFDLQKMLVIFQVQKYVVHTLLRFDFGKLCVESRDPILDNYPWRDLQWTQLTKSFIIVFFNIRVLSIDIPIVLVLEIIVILQSHTRRLPHIFVNMCAQTRAQNPSSLECLSSP